MVTVGLGMRPSDASTRLSFAIFLRHLCVWRFRLSFYSTSTHIIRSTARQSVPWREEVQLGVYTSIIPDPYM